MNKNKIICIAVFVLWIILTLTVGFFHEPWADEAQAWIIARDNSLQELLGGVLRYEGHPVLWYIILKIFQFCHLPYSALFLIPFLLTAIGMYLFLFKSKFPIWIKCIFPFTFYIAFQYSVIARNHSLFFPLMTFAAIFYPERIQKPLRYAFVLILLFFTSAYAYVISGVLFIFFLLDIIKSKEIRQRFFSFAIPISLLTFFALYVLISHQKPDDFFNDFADLKFIVPVHILLKAASAGYFNLSKYPDMYFQILAVCIFYFSTFIFFCKKPVQKWFFFSVNFSLIYIYAALFYNVWHSGYLIITYIFTLWVLLDENYSVISFKKKEAEKGRMYNVSDLPRQFFTVFFVYLFLVQIWWTAQCYYLDIKYPYCASKELADFIKENNLDKYGITGFGYRIVSLQPYFKENIFSNLPTSYWVWKTTQHYDVLERGRFLKPVIVLDKLQAKHYRLILDQLKYYGYEEHSFEGFLCSKGEIKEPTYLYLYVQKGILNKK